MTAMQKQFILTLADLRYISIECRQCSSVLTLDMTRLSEHQEKHGFFLPGVCSACRQPFDTATKTLSSFRDCYEELLQVPEKVTFRAEFENAESLGHASAAKD